MLAVLGFGVVLVLLYVFGNLKKVLLLLAGVAVIAFSLYTVISGFLKEDAQTSMSLIIVTPDIQVTVVPSVPVVPAATPVIVEQINENGVVTKFEEVDPFTGQTVTSSQWQEQLPQELASSGSKWCEAQITPEGVTVLAGFYGLPVVYEEGTAPQYRFEGSKGTLYVYPDTMAVKFDVAGHMLSPVSVTIGDATVGTLTITWVMTGSPCTIK